MTSEEKLAASAGKVDLIVEAIEELVRHCDPLQLLCSVYWHMYVHIMSAEGAPDHLKENVAWIWTLSYTLNLVAAIPPAPCESPLDPDEAALKARDLVDALFATVNRYVFEWADLELSDGERPPISHYLEALARHDWIHMRRSRSPEHDSAFLNLALSPHNEALRRCFDVDAAMLADALDRQVKCHAHAASLAMAHQFGLEVPDNEFMSLAAQDRNEIGFMFLFLKHNNPDLPRELREVAGERYCDFGAISKLPTSLLDALSWEPGGEQKFLAPGKFRGWPLLVTPLHQRPLLKLGGRYYCFNSEVLSTLLYRYMYWEIKKRDRSYSLLWKGRQEQVCEKFSAEWFSKVLPGAEIIHNYFVDDPTSMGKKRQRDVLVKFDDVIIFAESKAGKFAMLSPATHFKAYRESLEELVKAPFEQSMLNRTILEQGELVIYKEVPGAPKETYEEIRRFKRHEFRAIVCCGVMLETFPGPAATEASLRMLLKQDEAPPYWSVTVEDLLACSDLFESPTTFVNFLVWRTRASRPMELALEELDYVSGYLEQLMSGTDIPEPPPGVIPMYRGGTEAIARKYWCERTEPHQKSSSGVSSQEPPQDLAAPQFSGSASIVLPTASRHRAGSLFSEIQKFLDTRDHAGRARVAATLNGLSGPERKRLVSELDGVSYRAAEFNRGAILAWGIASMLIIASPENLPMLDPEARIIGLEFLKDGRRLPRLRNLEVTLIQLTLNRIGGLGDMRWQFLKPGCLI